MTALQKQERVAAASVSQLFSILQLLSYAQSRKNRLQLSSGWQGPLPSSAAHCLQHISCRASCAAPGISSLLGSAAHPYSSDGLR
jgi:hypothetical protein